MKCGVNFLLWTASNENDAQWIRRAGNMGFDWVEIPVFDPAQVDVSAVRAALRDTGQEVSLCSILDASRDISADDPAAREGGKKYIRECILLAEKIGAHIFAGPLYSAVGRLTGKPRSQEEYDRAVEGLKELGAFAADHGVTLCVEPLNRFETHMFNIAADVVKLVDDVDSPAVKAMIDTFHANIEEKNTADAIRLCGPRLAHVHACENDRGAPGTGQVHWDEIFAALREINYTGALVIESFVGNIPEIAAAAAIWRNIEPSADYTAQKGLEFLRKMTQG